MITVSSALQQILQLARPCDTETIDLIDAPGRVLADDITAMRDEPSFRTSAMDGYAVRSGDLSQGRSFEIIGQNRAGSLAKGDLDGAQTVQVFTGAPVPQSANMVIPKEYAKRDGKTVIFDLNDVCETNIRPIGSDFVAGAQLTAPTVLCPERLALVAAMNQPKVTVYRKPEVTIIPTGDELIMPGDEQDSHAVVASSGFGLSALLAEAGAKSQLMPIARDDHKDIEWMLGMAAKSDLIVTIGGASVGEYDLVHESACAVGVQMLFRRVAMRPGKPLMAGKFRDSLFVGVPGNPVSALVCGAIFLVPAIRAMLGLPPAARQTRLMPLAAEVPENGAREHYMRARMVTDGGQVMIVANEHQDSHHLRDLAGAHALIQRPAGDQARQAGESVPVITLGPGLEKSFEQV